MLIKYVLNLSITVSYTYWVHVKSLKEPRQGIMAYDKIYMQALGPPALVRHAKDVGPTS